MAGLAFRIVLVRVGIAMLLLMELVASFILSTILYIFLAIAGACLLWEKGNREPQDHRYRQVADD
jgi:hypothetical protein